MQVADFNDEDWPEGYGPAPVAPAPPQELEIPPYLREVPLHGDPVQPPAAIVATPFTWRAEAEIPARQWLYGKHLLSRFVSVDVAAGGTGKSSVKIGEALAMARRAQSLRHRGSRRAAQRLALQSRGSREESERRIHATAKWFHIAPADVDGRLYVDSGRDQRCVIATETDYGARIAQPVYEQIKAQLLERGRSTSSLSTRSSAATRSARTTTARSMRW
jgi:hypothetical protein